MSRPEPREAALTGIGARLPGPAGEPVRGPRQLWNTLLEGASTLGRYPQHRWEHMARRLHPDDRPRSPWPVAPLHPPEHVENAAFRLSAAEAQHLSPTQRLILEVAAEALEDAGLDPATLAGPDTGLYVGSASPDEAVEAFNESARPGLADLSAGGAGMLATPLSRWLDTRGPLLTMDTSCSSSLYALDAARRDVADGRVDTALVIGVNTARTPAVGRAFADGPVLAPEPASHPFDAAAEGFVRGEGVVAVVLRNRHEADQDRDRLYALLTHTRTGADGHSAATGAPSASAQAELLARTYSEAGVDPDEIGYLIAHGTATRAGDHAEARALGRVFGRGEHTPLWVGSVKGSFGHSEGAAGLLGVVAAALSLHHGRIPPTAGHRTPSPALGRHHLRVPTQQVGWPHAGSAHRAGVTSLGFSGAIAHAVLEQAPPTRPGHEDAGQQPDHVWALSAASKAALAEQADRLHEQLTCPDPPSAARVGAHLARRTDRRGPWRAALVHAPGSDGVAGLEALAQGHPHEALLGPARARTGRLAWVFGGHGAAHPHMGAQLYRADGVFARHMDQAHQALIRYTPAPWHPARGPARGLAQTQQATWAMQTALAATLVERWKLTPEVVVGHSLGEVAAAQVAGALDLDQAARLVVARSELLERVSPTGGMISLETDNATARTLAAAHGVEVAAINAPSLQVLSGPRERLEAVRGQAEQDGYTARELPAAPPAHSRAVEPVLDELADRLGRMDARPPRVEMVSTVSATSVQDLGADYWVRQLRSPVDYEAALACVARQGPVLAAELSPHPVLAVPTMRITARHHLDVQVATLVDGTDTESRGPARLAAWAHTHGHDLRQSDGSHPPLGLRPRTWRTHAPTDWLQALAGLESDEARTALAAWVHQCVEELAPVSVREADRDTVLEELGLNSMHRLLLRAEIMSHLPPEAATAVEQNPTINGISHTLGQTLTRAGGTAPQAKVGGG
ncbi:type I polyketide synthase [Nocardiopsis xinjiangensis]|uniref:type I polyketide synthase n=1 Tax=Nocardiopsis xinjiangensis TaxID=124285 RepID=UPI00034BC643|nr:type I polyketide synthase [Nocardiopsis xinjiangensis]